MDGDFPELSQIELSTIETAAERAIDSWLDEWTKDIAQAIEDAAHRAIAAWLDEQADELRDAIINAAVLRVKR